MVQPMVQCIIVVFAAEEALQIGIAIQVIRHAEIRAALPSHCNALIQPVAQRTRQIGAALRFDVRISIQVIARTELRATLPTFQEATAAPVGRQVGLRFHQVRILVVVVIPVEYRRCEFRVRTFLVFLLCAEEFLESVTGIVEGFHCAVGRHVRSLARFVLRLVVLLLGLLRGRGRFVGHAIEFRIRSLGCVAGQRAARRGHPLVRGFQFLADAVLEFGRIDVHSRKVVHQAGQIQ